MNNKVWKAVWSVKILASLGLFITGTVFLALPEARLLSLFLMTIAVLFLMGGSSFFQRKTVSGHRIMRLILFFKSFLCILILSAGGILWFFTETKLLGLPAAVVAIILFLIPVRNSSSSPGSVVPFKKRKKGQKEAIYVLINPAMEKDIYKIGRTSRNVKDRAKEISRGTGVVTDFLIAYEQPVKNSVKAEKMIHDRLSSCRINNKREFFRLPLKEAIKTIQAVITELDG